ncbi:MAG: hypothetical protein ACRD59_01325 [Candidatus Acidiferrales bacterium]
MNGRINHEDTPWGRLAAVARSLCLQMDKKHRATKRGPSQPDYADFREVFRPFIERELLRARIDEARKTSGRVLTDRMRELEKELLALKFPDGYELI